MLYTNVIKTFLNKETYSKYNRFINKEYLKDNNRDIYKVFITLEDIYNKYNEKDNFSVEDLYLHYKTLYPKDNPEVVFQAINDAQAQPEIIVEHLDSIARQERVTELGLIALDVSQGRSSWDILRQKMEELDQPVEALQGSEHLVSEDFDAIWDELYKGEGLNWRLKTLNASIGPLRKGNFGFIFARPETGKTTFCSSEATFMAENCKGTVEWFNNEEAGRVVRERTLQSLLGATEREIQANREAAKAEYKRRLQGRLRIHDNAILDRRYIEAECKANNPSLIIIDQIDKVYGFDGEREDLRLGKIYQWARELAKTYAPVIAVCQASAEAEGQKWLRMDHAANARTSKQAEADFIIGIGKDHDDHPNNRGIAVLKNKLLGGPDTQPENRHGKFDVIIVPEIGRYEDVQFK